MLATLRAKNQITLPSDIIKQLKLHEKSQIDININDNGQIILTPIEIVDKKMIDDLKESLNDIKNGNVSEAMTAKELIDKLGLQMYKLKTTQKFEKSVKKLPQKQKNKLPKTLLQLQNDPKHNSLYTKKIIQLLMLRMNLFTKVELITNIVLFGNMKIIKLFYYY